MIEEIKKHTSNEDKAEKIAVELQRLVKSYYGELLFNEGTEDDDDYEEGLIGGLRPEVIKMITRILKQK